MRPGVCWAPVMNALAAAEAPMVAPKAGLPMKANPNANAVKTAVNDTLAFLSGSTS